MTRSGMAHFGTADAAKSQFFASMCQNKKLQSRLGTDIFGVGVRRQDLGIEDRKEWTISVYLRSAEVVKELDDEIPNRFGGVRVSPQVMGRSPRFAIGQGPCRGRIFDPIKPGCSISLKGSDRSGTLGCLVGNGESLYMVTAGHVLNPHFAQPDEDTTDVVQSSSEYKQDRSRTIAYVNRVTALQSTQLGDEPAQVNDIDIAVAEVTQDTKWNLHVHGIGRQISGAIAAETVGRSRVKKYGQSTGYSEGMVYDRNTIISIKEPGTNECYWFQNAIVFFPKSRERSEFFAKPGDSGAIAWNSQGKPLAMIIGVSDRSAVAIPWQRIQDELGMGLLEHIRAQ